MTDNSNSEIPPVPPAGSAPSPDEPRLPASSSAAPPPPASSPPQQSYSPYASTTASEPKGLSIASMVAGIGGLVLSFAGIGILAAIAAVICGHLAQKREPYARPFWLTGLITGYVGIGLAVLFLLLLLPFVLLFFAGLGGGWDSYNY